jgi:pimeloyl-ACP methyl ester carboxylesterase
MQSTSSATRHLQLHADVVPKHDVSSHRLPLVLLHGLLGNGVNFRSITSNPAIKDGRQVVAVDLRNHGRSPHSQEPMTLDLLAEDVTHLLLQNRWNPCVLLGHSLGGKVASVVALRHPSLVAHLICMDIALTPYTSSDGSDWAAVHSLVQAAEKLDLSLYTNRKQVDEALACEIPNAGMRSFLQQNLVAAVDGHYTWRINLPVISKSMQYFADFAPPPPTGPYPAVNVPATFIAGSCSTFLRSAHYHRIRNFFPITQFHSIEGAGHWLHADKPGDLVRVLSSVLSVH